MGSDRDLTEEAREKNKRTFESPEVDVTYLCGCSPWHLLADTNHEKMLPRNGWDKVQDDFLRREWEKLPQEEKNKYGFEHDTMRVLEDLVGQIDKRMFLNKQKMASAEDSLPPEQRDKVFEIDQAIKQLQDKVQRPLHPPTPPRRLPLKGEEDNQAIQHSSVMSSSSSGSDSQANARTK